MGNFQLTSGLFVVPIVVAIFSGPVNGTTPLGSVRSTLAPEPLHIEVQPRGFGMTSATDIRAVLQSAAGEIKRYCPPTQLPGIDVYHRTDHPQFDFKRTSSGRLRIGLTAQDTHWAQYSFQFAHEFCHALANHGYNSQPLGRSPSEANLWFEESLCETASLFTLRAMGRSWQITPPYPAWRAYAPWFNAYVEQRLAGPEHRLPPGTPFVAWFREQQPALRRNPGLRDSNAIIAMRLLPLFEAEPRAWTTVVFLNQGPMDATESLSRHLANWRSQAPKGFHPFITRLAAVFGVRWQGPNEVTAFNRFRWRARQAMVARQGGGARRNRCAGQSPFPLSGCGTDQPLSTTAARPFDFNLDK